MKSNMSCKQQVFVRSFPFPKGDREGAVRMLPKLLPRTLVNRRGTGHPDPSSAGNAQPLTRASAPGTATC